MPPGWAVTAASFTAGSIPFSGLAARLLAGVDLRDHGSGTVSGTGLYAVAGFPALAVAGSLDVAKGAVGPLLAGPDRPTLGALGGALAVTGHNWSPWLGGAGGRGLSPAIGVMAVTAPEGSACLLAGLAVGRLARQTGLGSLVAMVATIPLLGRRRGAQGALVAACAVGPIIVKRLVGNRPPPGDQRGRVLLARLLFDRDQWGDEGPGRGTSGGGGDAGGSEAQPVAKAGAADVSPSTQRTPAMAVSTAPSEP